MDPNVLGDLLVPANSSVTFNATLTGVPPMTVAGRVSVNGTIVIDARTIVNTTGPYNLNVFTYTGPKPLPPISPDKIDVLLGNDSCLKVSNVQTITVGDLFVVRIDVASDCLTTQPAPPAIVDEFPVIPVAVGASVGFCVLMTVIVVIVVCVCRRRKQADEVDDPHAADFASRTALTPQRDTRVPIRLRDLRAQPHNYEQTDEPLGDGTASSPLGSVYNVVSAAEAAQMAPDGIYDQVGTGRNEYHSVGKPVPADSNYDSIASGRSETLQYHRVGRGAKGAAGGGGGGGGNQEGTYDSVSGMVNALETNEYDSARFEEGNYHSARM
jgi:hypothetical protein